MATTLYQLFKSTGAADNLSAKGEDSVADAILSLIKLNETPAEFHGVSPRDILVNEETGVFTIGPSRRTDPYYCAPEVLFSGKEPDEISEYFTLGMLVYFVIYGESYYRKNNIPITELPGHIADIESLLGCTINKKLNEALKKLTLLPESAFNERQEGITSLLEYIITKTAGAKVVLQTSSGSGILMLKVPSKGLAIRKKMVLKDRAGNAFEVQEDRDIPFRPGIHTYTVRSASRSGDASPAAAAPEDAILGVINMRQPRQVSRLFPVADAPASGTIEVDRTKANDFVVVLLKGDSGVEPRYRFTIPAHTITDCRLILSYKPENEITVTVIDKATGDPVTPVSDNTLTFRI